MASEKSLSLKLQVKVSERTEDKVRTEDDGRNYISPRDEK